ncbi:TPA: hypothetical protein NGR22_003045 [Vibrio parahaemolyticus]|nr:hypothetical protein [Vibrio parahaemolyticus]
MSKEKDLDKEIEKYTGVGYLAVDEKNSTFINCHMRGANHGMVSIRPEGNTYLNTTIVATDPLGSEFRKIEAEVNQLQETVELSEFNELKAAFEELKASTQTNRPDLTERYLNFMSLAATHTSVILPLADLATKLNFSS